MCAQSVIYWAGFLRRIGTTGGQQAKISAMRCHDYLNITCAMPMQYQSGLSHTYKFHSNVLHSHEWWKCFSKQPALQS
jgi:hypothetical protein